MQLNQDEDFDAFAEAKWNDSWRVIKERETAFELSGFSHSAYQDLTDGGWIIDSIQFKWRPRPMNNGHSHGAPQP